MMTMTRVAALLAAAAAIAACGASGDAEHELRSLIDDAEAAAEARDTGHFRGLISRDYRDTRGNGRDDAINWLRAYFLMHQRVEIVTRVEDVVLHGSDAANVVLRVASIGVRGRADSGAAIGGFSGELERLELELVREGGDWRIIRASWR
jgi:hypothetical protein